MKDQKGGVTYLTQHSLSSRGWSWPNDNHICHSYVFPLLWGKNLMRLIMSTLVTSLQVWYKVLHVCSSAYKLRENRYLQGREFDILLTLCRQWAYDCCQSKVKLIFTHCSHWTMWSNTLILSTILQCLSLQNERIKCHSIQGKTEINRAEKKILNNCWTTSLRCHSLQYDIWRNALPLTSLDSGVDAHLHIHWELMLFVHFKLWIERFLMYHVHYFLLQSLKNLRAMQCDATQLSTLLPLGYLLFWCASQD